MAKFTAPQKSKENPLETHFRWFLDDLQKEGYIKRYDREIEKFLVLPEKKHEREIHHKTKPNSVELFTFLKEITYHYDFRIIWTEKAQYFFYELYNSEVPFVFGMPKFVAHIIEIKGQREIVSYIDVKPHSAAAKFGGGKLSTYYTFPFVQKLLFDRYSLYINKIIPTHTGKHGVNTCLFATTFVPTRYLYTESGNQPRKLPYKKKSLTTYINNMKGIIDKMLAKKASEIKQGELFNN